MKIKGMREITLGDGLRLNPLVESFRSERFGVGFEKGEEELALPRSRKRREGTPCGRGFGRLSGFLV